MEPRILLQALGWSVLLAALFVVGRLVWCLVDARRARRPRILAASVIGIACMVALLGAFVVVWFGYAVAHVEKDAASDLTLFLMTVPPYFLLSIGLWWLGGRLRSRLRPPTGPQDTH